MPGYRVRRQTRSIAAVMKRAVDRIPTGEIIVNCIVVLSNLIYFLFFIFPQQNIFCF